MWGNAKGDRRKEIAESLQNYWNDILLELKKILLQEGDPVSLPQA